MIRIATRIVEGLKAQPLALALIVVNLMFIIGFSYMLREIGQSVTRKDQLLSELAKDCMVSAPKGDRQ
jgi:hypothetical protein